MANNFLTPSVIANEALMVLESNMVMAGLVHRDYSNEFVNVGDTVTIRKPASFVAKNFTGNISTQDATEGSVAVKLDRFRDVSVDVTSQQLTLDIRDFSQQVVTPAMQAIAQAVDEDLLAVGIEKAGAKVAATPNPTDLKDIANIGKTFDLNKVPVQNRRLVMHPTHKYAYVTTDNLSKVSYAGDNRALRDALLGSVYTMDTYMDQNAPDTTAQTAGTATTYKITAEKGATAVALSSVSAATGTVKAGDAFIYKGYLYRFTADATAAGNAIASVAIDQPLMDAAAAADVTIIKKPHSLAFHRNGLALVTRQLALPMGAAKAAIQSANGLAVRVVYGYNQTTKTDTVSFDVIYGIKELEPKMLVTLA